jgi:pimeloyl-ACP methyl ester carboxylesterase
VVLLHGFPENRTSWQAVTPLLVDAGFRVLAPDQRGYSPGARPLDRRSYVIGELVEDVVALVRASGADKVHLVGHDWGGGVAWAFAHMHPELLHTVTSLTTPHPRAFSKAMVVGTQAFHSWYMAMFQLPGLPEAAITARGGRNFKRGLVNAGLTEEAAERYAAPLRDRDAARAAVNWYRGLPLSKPPTGKVTVPAMYVYATKDRFLGRKAADLTADYVAGPYRYEVLEGRTHWLPEEAPADVARLIVEHARAHS